MKRAREKKLQRELAVLKSYLAATARRFWDEALELCICYLLSSHTMDTIITLLQGTFIHDILVFLQNHQNLAGLLKIAFPLLLFLVWRLIRYLIARHVQKWRHFQLTRNASIRIDMKNSFADRESAASSFKTFVT